MICFFLLPPVAKQLEILSYQQRSVAKQLFVSKEFRGDIKIQVLVIAAVSQTAHI